MAIEITKDSTREDVESRLAELRNDFAEIPERERRSADDQANLRSMIEEVEELDTRLTLEDLSELREERKRRLELAREGGGPSAATAQTGIGRRGNGIGDLLMDSDEFKEWEKRGLPEGGNSPGQRLLFSVEMQNLPMDRQFESRAIDEWTSGGPPNAATGDAAALLPVGQPIPPIPRQARLYLRDLLPKMNTSLAQVPYVRELSPTATEFGASAVSEGSTKPDNAVNFQSAVAPNSVIAATMTLSKQLFEDSPAVVQYVNQRLPYLIKFKENNEILNGSGTWPDITGIYNTTGLLTQSATSGEFAITLGNSFAKVENEDGTPTGVVLNPTDAWSMFTKRAAGGSGTFDAGTPFNALPLTVWGVPSYRTRAQTAGNALVGDFQLGGMLVDREQVNVQVYRERFADQNLILLVCEERVGLMVFRPDLFCSVTLS